MAKYNNSRFYWLQLKEDFFDEDAIDWLEDQPNGKEYSLFYLKLCLKSLRTNGILIRKVGSMLLPYDHIKLGELTKTNPDTVIVAMELLTKIGLVKKLENGELYITQVENMIGSQSIGAFKKQQQLMRRENNLIEGGTRVEKIPPNIDIDIEKDKEIEIDLDKDINKKKTRKKKEFIPPTLDDVVKYANERNRTDLAQKFFDYYNAGEWKDQSGKPVLNWKQKFITWENKNSVTQPYQQSKQTAPKQSNNFIDNLMKACEDEEGAIWN